MTQYHCFGTDSDRSVRFSIKTFSEDRNECSASCLLTKMSDFSLVYFSQITFPFAIRNFRVSGGTLWECLMKS